MLQFAPKKMHHVIMCLDAKARDETKDNTRVPMSLQEESKELWDEIQRGEQFVLTIICLNVRKHLREEHANEADMCVLKQTALNRTLTVQRMRMCCRKTIDAKRWT